MSTLPAADRVISRRTFLGLAAATQAFTLVSCHVLGRGGRIPPSDRVNVASIGAGGMAANDIEECHKAGANIVALCDVDDEYAAETYKKFPRANRYKDFRHMLDREHDRIDAVIVGTPDHTHAVAVMEAIQRGKHVYCEKPLARSVYEVRTLMKAARQYNVRTQLGNQGHSYDHIRLFCEWIWDGAIGPVREVHVFCDSSYGRMDELARLGEVHDIPGTLDWNLWLGPAPERQFNPMYIRGLWRGWTRFGTGAIGDWVCHLVDPVFWALDLKSPVRMRAETGDYDPGIHGESYPAALMVHYEFPARGQAPPCRLVWYDGGLVPPRPAELEEGREMPQKGALVIGDRGKIIYGSHGADGVRLIPEAQMKAYQKPEPSIRRSIGHRAEWLEACRGGAPAGSAFDYGGPLTEIGLLGLIAIRLRGETLEWDGDLGRFSNSDRANELLREPYRQGWTLG